MKRGAWNLPKAEGKQTYLRRVRREAECSPVEGLLISTGLWECTPVSGRTWCSSVEDLGAYM